MTNPYLVDTVARAARDPLRKLSYTDRIYGTMVEALEQGVPPTNMALGAAAGLATLYISPEEHGLPEELRIEDWRNATAEHIAQTCRFLWRDDQADRSDELIELTQQAYGQLPQLLE